MACCSKIGEFLKKIVNALRPLLAVVLLCTAAYFAFFTGPGMIAALEGFTFLPAFITAATAPASVWAFAALGAALLIDGETVGEIAGSVASTVGEIAGDVASSVATGVLGGLFGGSTSVTTWLALAALAYFFIFSDGAKNNRQSVSNAFTSDGGGASGRAKQEGDSSIYKESKTNGIKPGDATSYSTA